MSPQIAIWAEIDFEEDRVVFPTFIQNNGFTSASTVAGGERRSRPEEKHRGGTASSCTRKKRKKGTEVSVLGKPRVSARREGAARGKFMLFAVSVSWSIVHHCPRPSSRGADTFRNDNLLVLLHALSAVHLSVSKKGGWPDSPPAT